MRALSWRNTLIVLGVSIVLSGCFAEKEVKEEPKPPSSAPQKEKTSFKDSKRAAEYNVQLGMGYLEQGNPERAKAKLMLALKQSPNLPLVLSAMGYFWEVTGEPARGEVYYRKAVEVNPKDGAPHNNYGTFLCRRGRYVDAEKHFMLAIKDPDYTSPGEAYENAGLCAMQVGEIDKSEKFFIKALQRQPHLPNSLLELSQISYDKAEYDLAKKYLSRYQQLQKPTAESLWLGIRLAWQMDNQGTVKEYAALLKSQFAGSNEYKDFLEAEKVA